MVRALDTPFLIDVLRGHRGPGAKVKASDAAEEVLADSAPVLADLLDGAHVAGGPYLARAMPRISECHVIPFDRECSLVAGESRAEPRARGEPLPRIDARNVATALRHRCVLATGAVGSGRVPGLAVEAY